MTGPGTQNDAERTAPHVQPRVILAPPVDDSFPEMPSPTHRTSQIRAFFDRLAKRVITLGGIAVLFSILTIFLYLVLEVLPLFQRPTATLRAQVTLPADFAADSPVRHATVAGLDEHQEIAYLVSPSGVGFFDLKTGQPIPVEIPPAIRDARVTAIADSGATSSRYLLGTAEGTVIPLKIGIATEFSASGERFKRPFLIADSPLRIAESPVTALAYRASDSGTAIVALTQRSQLLLLRPEGNGEDVPVVPPIPLPTPPGHITAIAIDAPLLNVYLGTEDGGLHHISLKIPNRPEPVGSYHTGSGAAITRLGFLIGDRSLVVMTAAGTVSTWIPVGNPVNSNQWVLRQNHLFASHPAPVTAFSPSKRDKGFITGDSKGTLFLHHATSEQTLLRLPGRGTSLTTIAFAPKADGLLALDATGRFTAYGLRNPHPEVTLTTLFKKVWYEGYDKPAYAWQSSSGSDDFEPKLSLTPLAFGTIKGTIYALLLAIPLAILGAIFTSQFMHPNLRTTIKPAMEVMAALPTVVLGFVAGLWLAPLLERLFAAFVGMLIAIPLTVVAVSGLWQFFPHRLRNRLQPGSEALLLIPLLAGAIAGCLWANDALEQWMFAGDFQSWLSDRFEVRYDQRNAVVVGIVMGFAVIPIIYSISEEALTNVPRHLIAGSLALGATRWQTVTFLVVLTASPGIFSAVMIGFGRAIGETMIVIMATGNTPIMDWSWFNGFRTLSANIAVEIPEAPEGGTLYRVLFMAALLLFLVTFVINTAAELIRQRLRKRYSHL